MGEHSIVEIADALSSGIPVEELTYIAGTVFKCKDLSRIYEPIILPSYEEVKEEHTQTALPFSIKIQTRLPPDQWQSLTEQRDISYRILRRCL